MCNCASCEYTDSFAKKSFTDWPRGNPAGRKAAREYTSHVKHSLQWGRRQNGNMYHAPEFSAADLRIRPEPYYGPTTGRSVDGGAHRSYPTQADAKLGTAHYVAAFIAANPYATSKGPVLPGPDARLTQACKPAQHLRRRDRPAPPQAEVYSMAEEKEKRKKMGRPALPGKRVIVKLDEKQIARVKAMGDGSFTKGLRALLVKVG